MSKETLHILHHSSQWSDSDDQNESDMRFCFAKDPDILTFTELSPHTERRQRMLKVAREKGYRPIAHRGDTALAIRTNAHMKVKGSYSQPVHGGVSQDAPGIGAYRPRTLCVAHVNFHGQDIFISVSHWATRAQDGGIYRVHFNKMVKAVVDKMASQHKKGIAFHAGDMNADPDEAKYPKEAFREGRILTCWDEKNVEPATRFGRSIDIIARRKDEKRAELKRFKVWQANINSDHRPFSCWYEIDTTKKKNQGGNNPGEDKGKDPDKKGDKYPNAGNRNWRDYKDNEVYDLPQAVDDSDLFNG